MNDCLPPVEAEGSYVEADRRMSEVGPEPGCGETTRAGTGLVCGLVGGAALDGGAAEGVGAPMNIELTSKAGAVAFIAPGTGVDALVGVLAPLLLVLATETAGAAAAVEGVPLLTAGGRPPAAAASSVPN